LGVAVKAWIPSVAQGVTVGVGVFVGTNVDVFVGTSVGVEVGISVGDEVGISVGVDVRAGRTTTRFVVQRVPLPAKKE
jgi:hypothetical protein